MGTGILASLSGSCNTRIFNLRVSSALVVDPVGTNASVRMRSCTMSVTSRTSCLTSTRPKCSTRNSCTFGSHQLSMNGHADAHAGHLGSGRPDVQRHIVGLANGPPRSVTCAAHTQPRGPCKQSLYTLGAGRKTHQTSHSLRPAAASARLATALIATLPRTSSPPTRHQPQRDTHDQLQRSHPAACICTPPGFTPSAGESPWPKPGHPQPAPENRAHAHRLLTSSLPPSLSLSHTHTRTLSLPLHYCT